MSRLQVFVFCMSIQSFLLFGHTKSDSCEVREPHITLGDHFSLEKLPGSQASVDSHVYTVGLTVSNDCDTDDVVVVLRSKEEEASDLEPIRLEKFLKKEVNLDIQGVKYQKKDLFFKIMMSHVKQGYQTWEIRFDGDLVHTVEDIPVKPLKDDDDIRIFSIADFDLTEVAQPTWGQLSKMKTDDYDMILHIGDAGYEIWHEHGKLGDRYYNRSSESARKIPFIFTPGNHENYGEGMLFNYRFRMPNSADVTNSMFDMVYKGTYFMFVNLDWILRFETKQYREHFSRERQMLEWMDSRYQILKKRTDIRWKVFATHRPFECSDPYAADCTTTMLFFAKIYDKVTQMGFHLSLHAHLHSYMRNSLFHRFQKFNWSQIGEVGPLRVVNGHAGTIHYFQTENYIPELQSPIVEAIEVSGPTFLRLQVSTKKIFGNLIRSDTDEVKDKFEIEAKTPVPQEGSRGPQVLVIVLVVVTIAFLALWYRSNQESRVAPKTSQEGYQMVVLDHQDSPKKTGL